MFQFLDLHALTLFHFGVRSISGNKPFGFALNFKTCSVIGMCRI